MNENKDFEMKIKRTKEIHRFRTKSFKHARRAHNPGS